MKAKQSFQTRKQGAWKLPGLVIVGLICMILFLPTLVVLPFISKDTHEQVAIEKKMQNVETVAEEEEEEAAVTVSVMRHQTEDIEDVPFETYVSRVIANEMPAEFELEALKAQALAARTFIVNLLLQEKGEDPDGYDVTDTENHQVYSNDDELKKKWGADYHEKMSKITEAVNATKGEILTYKNNPIFPAFFSTSNGFTENSEDYWKDELPYLRSVKSEWDKDSPKFLDQKIMEIGEVATALNIQLPANQEIPIAVSRTESERVKEITIGEHKFSGRVAREKLNLRSNDFTVKQKNNHLIFTTKGFGHGVGMSQYGANGMAQEGKTYEEIVKYYYQDIEITKMTDSVPALVSR